MITKRATGTCPDLEQLASFIDGCLEGEERRRVMEHLDGCVDCWEIYVETLRSQPFEALDEDACDDPEDEDEADGANARPLAPVVEHPAARRFWRPAIAAAAVVLLAVATWRFFPALDFDSATLVEASLPAGASPTNETLTDFEWPELRNLVPRKDFLPAEERHFQLGVRQVALIAALDAGDTSAAQTSIYEINALLEASGQLVQPLENAYRRLLEQLETGAAEGLSLEAVPIGREVDRWMEEDPASRGAYRLGKGTMAGFLAARAGHREFFDRAYRRTLKKQLKAAPGLSEETLTAARLVGEQLDAGDPPLTDLAVSLETLLRVGGGG